MADTHGKPRVSADGTIAYPKRGWEPPPVPDGYRRKSNHLASPDAWIMVPVLPTCKHRTQQIEHTPCNAARMTYHCTVKGEPTNAVRCQRCQQGL